jgi:hypothetical protein
MKNNTKESRKRPHIKEEDGRGMG